MRHAILVMGHGDLNIMKKYMEILDDERFDFLFILIKKAKMMVSGLRRFAKNQRSFSQKEFQSSGDITVKPKRR